jgi:hypothetical protein
MLVIRTEQIAVLREDAGRQFVAQLVAHSQRFFAAQCRHAGEQAVTATVELALQLSRAGGWRARREVALYLNLMWMLGSHFESDPRYAGLLGAATAAATGFDRLLAGTRRANDGLDVVQGPDNARLLRMLVRVRDLEPDSLPAADAVAAWLARLAPGHAEQDANAIALAERAAADIGARRRLGGDAAHAVLALLALLLGSAFDRDPQFPWAMRVFDERGDAAARLLAQARRYAQALLDASAG